MHDPEEIAQFYDRTTAPMRDLLEALAAAPEQPRTFAQVEDALAWPRRRSTSVLGAVWHLQTTEFDGRRPYRLMDEVQSPSGRREIWVDSAQADAIRAYCRRLR